MKKRGTGLWGLVVFGLAMTLLTFGLPSRTSAQASNFFFVYEDSFPFSGFNECTGEQVSGTVTVKGRIHITRDSSEGFHLQDIATFWGEGVGEESGTKYVGPQTTHEGHYQDQILTSTLNFRFISAGSSDNIIMRALFHRTVANGEVTSFLEVMSFECHG